MSFGELIFLAFLGLMIFGPRKLPEVARTFGKIMAELRRASNEFRYSLEEEVRNLEMREQAQRRLEATQPPPVEGTVAHSLERPQEQSQPHAEHDPHAAPLAEPGDGTTSSQTSQTA